MPFAWKVKGFNTKRVLRDVSRGIVPNEIIRRAKTGFSAPYRKWLRYDLEEMWNDLTAEVSLRRRGWFNLKGVKEVRESSQKGNVDLYMLQWGILTIELWARQFIDGGKIV